MTPDIIIKENWFTRPPQKSAGTVTLLMSFFMLFAGIYYLQDTFNVRDWMPASRETVFTQREYWRLWSTLWAHGDFGHLMNNAVLFIPLTYLLSAYFSYYFFPVLGILVGGFINAIVLTTMPETTYLIGVSGVVYWMGGAWFTLFLWIDNRKNFRYRFANVLFLMLMIFIPENYSVQISYLSHFVGFVLGIVCGSLVYWLWKGTFAKAEVQELVADEEIYDFLLDSEEKPYPEIHH